MGDVGTIWIIHGLFYFWFIHVFLIVGIRCSHQYRPPTCLEAGWSILEPQTTSNHGWNDRKMTRYRRTPWCNFTYGSRYAMSQNALFELELQSCSENNNQIARSFLGPIGRGNFVFRKIWPDPLYTWSKHTLSVILYLVEAEDLETYRVSSFLNWRVAWIHDCHQI